MLPTVDVPERSPARFVRKLPSVALLLFPPSRSIRLWKLDSRLESWLEPVVAVLAVLAVEVLELAASADELALAAASDWMRLCRSLCRPPVAAPVDEADDVDEDDDTADPLDAPPSPSQAPPEDEACVPLLCECKAAIRLCMKLASAWPTSPLEVVELPDDEALDAVLAVPDELPAAPICDSACATACSRPPPGGGGGGGVPPSASRPLAAVDVELLPDADASWLSACSQLLLPDMLLIDISNSFS